MNSDWYNGFAQCVTSDDLDGTVDSTVGGI